MAIENLLTAPAAAPLIGASILSADFAEMGKEARSVLRAGSDFLHFDVMDGHFVPNLTMGPNMCRSLRRVLPDAFFDVHLMVTDPEEFVVPFAEAGANHLTFHVEAARSPIDLAETIRNTGLTAGLALNPPTALQEITPYLRHFDLLLVMSVHPGYAGQAFIDDVLEKCRSIGPMLGPRQRLAVDGGVNPQTAPRCLDAGCDVLVAASAIFGSADYEASIQSLRGGSGVGAERR